MKKTLIVGAVSGMMAILPLAEAFATTNCGTTYQISDSLSVTVNSVCEFTRTSGTGSYSIAKDTGSLDATLTSTFKVVCNNKTGFTTKGAFSSLSGTGEAITYTSSAAPTAGSGTWTAIKGATSEAATTSNMIATNGTVMSSSGVTGGTSQQVSYKIGVRTNQAAGAYSGTATYTTTQNS